MSDTSDKDPQRPRLERPVKENYRNHVPIYRAPPPPPDKKTK